METRSSVIVPSDQIRATIQEGGLTILMARQNIDTLAALGKPLGRATGKGRTGQVSSNRRSARVKWKSLWEGKLGERWQRANSMGKHGGLGQSRGRDDDHVLTRFLSNIEDVETDGTTTTAIDHGKRPSLFLLALHRQIQQRDRESHDPGNFVSTKRQNFSFRSRDAKGWGNIYRPFFFFFFTFLKWNSKLVPCSNCLWFNMIQQSGRCGGGARVHITYSHT